MSKMFIPQAVGDPPRMSSNVKENAQSVKKVQKGAAYYLTLLQPWWAVKKSTGEVEILTTSGVDGTVSKVNHTYAELVKFTDILKQANVAFQSESASVLPEPAGAWMIKDCVGSIA